MSQYDLMLHLKIKVGHCDLYFMISFALYFEDYLMYKHVTMFFLVYVVSILLLMYDKGHRLRIFYIYSIYIKVWCKKFAYRRW